MDNILILDMYNCCYRALRNKQITNTNVLQKGLSFINNLEKELKINWNYVYACFDSDFYWRKELYTDYKRNRTEFPTPTYTSLFIEQINILYEVMENIGFTSVRVNGFEADDLIAKICNSFQEDFKVVISTDEDLLQLLKDKNVTIFVGKKGEPKSINRDDFINKYGIPPTEWVTVKSMAGCYSDNIKGIKGIGEKTAIAYLKGNTSATINKKIIENLDVIKKNYKLVNLPLESLEHKIPEIKKKPFELNINYLKMIDEKYNLDLFIDDWQYTWNQTSLF